MKNQVWYIALLIGLMCLIRFGLSVFGYATPQLFMKEIGISLSSNLQMPYAIRAWAVRDMVISILVAMSEKTIVKILLIGCVAIDFIDIISAYLSAAAGLFGAGDNWLLKLTSTAIACLILELGAIFLLFREQIKEKAKKL